MSPIAAVIVSGKNKSDPFVATPTVWTVAAMVVVFLNKKKRNKCLADGRRSEEQQFAWDDKITLSRRASKGFNQGQHLGLIT
jgi:hypothetical protein